MRVEVGRPSPDFVEEEFAACLKYGHLEEGFPRLRSEHCHAERGLPLYEARILPLLRREVLGRDSRATG